MGASVGAAGRDGVGGGNVIADIAVFPGVIVFDDDDECTIEGGKGGGDNEGEMAGAV